MESFASTVFYAPRERGRRTPSAFLFHEGHTNCVCERAAGAPMLHKHWCRANAQYHSIKMPSAFWDLNDLVEFVHSLGFDAFFLGMPLYGANHEHKYGPPASKRLFSSKDHWWFLQHEQQGDHGLRYFLEPILRTIAFATAQGYTDLVMAGISGGGWATTLVAAMDPRIRTSFPVAGSLPCAFRDAAFNKFHWPGPPDKPADYEQSCHATTHATLPGRQAYQICNFTCLYLLSALEPGRAQVQILHEEDPCCFRAPQARQAAFLEYEGNIRAELRGDGRGDASGVFAVTADRSQQHVVGPLDRQILVAVLQHQAARQPWSVLPCDLLHRDYVVDPHCRTDKAIRFSPIAAVPAVAADMNNSRTAAPAKAVGRPLPDRVREHQQAVDVILQALRQTSAQPTLQDTEPTGPTWSIGGWLLSAAALLACAACLCSRRRVLRLIFN